MSNYKKIMITIEAMIDELGKLRDSNGNSIDNWPPELVEARAKLHAAHMRASKWEKSRIARTSIPDLSYELRLNREIGPNWETK